jgi:hypothetical protein
LFRWEAIITGIKVIPTLGQMSVLFDNSPFLPNANR